MKGFRVRSWYFQKWQRCLVSLPKTLQSPPGLPCTALIPHVEVSCAQAEQPPSWSEKREALVNERRTGLDLGWYSPGRHEAKKGCGCRLYIHSGKNEESSKEYQQKRWNGHKLPMSHLRSESRNGFLDLQTMPSARTHEEGIKTELLFKTENLMAKKMA